VKSVALQVYPRSVRKATSSIALIPPRTAVATLIASLADSALG
jgi:hypothetical protein